METPPTTLRELYPDARSDAPLKVWTPKRTQVSGRAWARFIGACIVLGIAIFGVGWIGGLVNADGVNDLVGGTGVTYDDDGDPNALAGSWLERLMWGSFIAGALTFGIMRLYLHGLRDDAHVSWRRFAHDRGLLQYAHPTLDEVPFDMFHDGRDRDWRGMLTGRLASGAKVVVGGTAWTTGSGKNKTRHRMVFAYVQLPAHVAAQFRGCSVTRYLRGVSGATLDADGEELRLESTALDGACAVKVEGSAAEPHWRELFDPTLVAALAEHHDVQWKQQGQHLVFVEADARLGKAAAETLDTMCLGANAVYSQFLAAAREDAPQPTIS